MHQCISLDSFPRFYAVELPFSAFVVDLKPIVYERHIKLNIDLKLDQYVRVAERVELIKL